MFVYSFVDFVPPPRFDNISWHHVTVEEAAAQAGPFTLIDTLNIGVDADPAHPAPRSFTTNNATLSSGWYRITFWDVSNSDQAPVAPVHTEAAGESSYFPTIQDVAMKVLSRTKDQYGNVLGTFGANTNPTDSQVLSIIARVAPAIGDVVGDDLPDYLWDDAANVLAERAAMQIELDFYSEQVNTGRSIYPQLEKLYKDDLAALERQAMMAAEGGTSVTGAAVSNKPSYSFPDANTWLTRLM